ncbi:hypothetical protein [Streptomyces sp. NPDC094049]|uniref:hypothetical protein n=1 Tax=Streptomyces sp. NPDC094049 TaxID=3154987 RepID=UPI0033197846
MGEGELASGPHRVGEGDDRGETDLHHHGPLASRPVLLGLVAAGFEPLAFGAAIRMMMAERGLAAPAAGGSVVAQWDTILTAAAPSLLGTSGPSRTTRDPGAWTSSPTPPRTAQRSAGSHRN